MNMWKKGNARAHRGVGAAGRGRLNLARPSIGPGLRRTIGSGKLQVPEPSLPGI